MRRFVIRSWWGAPAAVLVLLIVSIPGSARAENRKHHLGFALGYEKHLSDDLKGGGLDPDFSYDFTDAGYASLAYRLSVLRNLDITFDSRATAHVETINGDDLTFTTGFFGPGLRLISPSEGLRPYMQANFFFVSESTELEQGGYKISTDDSGVGFGISSGVDIHASNLLSVPIEVNYMYGKPNDDISGIGANIGLTFNFGHLK